MTASIRPRLDSFVSALAGKRITCKELIAEVS